MFEQGGDKVRKGKGKGGREYVIKYRMGLIMFEKGSRGG